MNKVLKGFIIGALGCIVLGVILFVATFFGGGKEKVQDYLAKNSGRIGALTYSIEHGERDEFKVDGNPDVDFSLTTRELAELIKQFNIDFNSLDEEDFDMPLGASTGASVIFGATGGVIEAAARTAYEVFTGKTLGKVDFTELRGLEGVREATIDFDGTPIHLGIAHGLGNARKLLDQVRKGEVQYHAIEVMACPGGCVNGGGQPQVPASVRNFTDIRAERAKALYTLDEKNTIRFSHENPDVKELYASYLGEPGSHKAHELLHTTYVKRKIHEI